VAIVVIAYYVFPDVICPAAYKGDISPYTKDPIQGACSVFNLH